MEILKIAHLKGHQGSVFKLTHATEGKSILSGAGDGWIVEWDIDNPDTGKLLAKVDSNIYSLLFLPNIHTVIVGNMNGGIHFVDIEQPQNNKNIAHHQKGVFDIQYFNNQIYTLGGDGIVTRWNLAPFQSLESLQISTKSLRCMDYSVLRNEIVIGASDGNIYFLDTQLNLKNVIKQAHKNSIFSIKYSADSSHLLTGGRDALLKIWHFNKKSTELSKNLVLLNEIEAHNFTINDVKFNPQYPSVFATASRDKTIKIWHLNPQLSDAKLLKVINTVKNGGHINSVNSINWVNGNLLASASDDRSIIVWKLFFEGDENI
jgi:WD40 repeat protein